MRRTGWVIAAVAVVAALAWGLRPRPIQVDAATVAPGTFLKTVDEDGKTRVRERYVVSAPITGHLLRIALEVGDAVEPGTLLATLVPPSPALIDVRTEEELQQRVGAAEARHMATTAAVKRAEAASALARSELERQASLAQQGFASRQAVDRVQREAELRAADVDVAQFDDHAAEHELAMARAALTRAQRKGAANDAAQRFEIRAPVAGRVLRIVQESETNVAIGAALLEIGDPEALEAVVDILSTDAEAVAAGALVRFDPGPGGVALAGRVRLVEPSAFTKVSALGIEEQRVNVVIDFTNSAVELAKLHLGDGYRVDAHIVVDRRDDALMVPTGALFRRGDGWAVFRIADGQAHATAVRIGPRNASHAVVEDGLVAGARVIVYPTDAIRDGVRVAPR
ncbi:MAG: efflux RND transporter periplasmic adaptor subunit [Betaproteobacteria bacterium]